MGEDFQFDVRESVSVRDCEKFILSLNYSFVGISTLIVVNKGYVGIEFAHLVF